MQVFKYALAVAVTAIVAVRSVLAIAPMPETINRDEALRQAREVTREAAPDARSLVFAKTRYAAYAPDGSNTTWSEMWIKSFTDEGAKDLRDIPLWYKKGFSECEFQMVEIVRPDGTVVPIDIAKNLKDVSSNDGNAENIYDENSRQLVITLPQFEKGDVLHLIFARHTARPRVPDTFMEFEIFESTECPLPYAALTIVAPKELPLKSMAVLDEVPGTMTSSREQLADGRMVYRWVARNVPQTFPEENMPEEETQLQRVIVSTFTSWEELSAWYWSLCEPHLKVTPSITAKVKELTEGKTREEKITALFSFVAQEIRYMGIIAEDNSPGYEPHDASLTFDNRYGVCRDKGALLVAMMRHAGINAFPVLIHSGSQRDREVPITFFNHAIIAIDDGDREYRLMDPTDETARAAMPAYLSDCSFVVARPEGETLRISPVPSPADHLLAIDTNATLNASGDLEIEATLHFNGINDNAYRPLIVKNTPEALRERTDGLVKRVLPGAELVSISYTPENPRDITQPLTMTFKVRVSDYAVPDAAGHTLVRLPYFSRVFGVVNFLFEGLSQPTRKYDWVIATPCAVRETLTLRGFNALGEPQLLPQDPVLKSNGASYDVICKRDAAADTITLTRDLELSHKTYSPEDYRALRRFIERMSRYEELSPLFVKSAALQEDATVLKDYTETVLNADGTVARRQIRDVRVNTFQGKRSQGEVKLWYSPEWQNLTLNVAEVTAANGDCIPVTAKEINELDSDGAARSPRYASWKQRVISLPAVEIGSTSHIDWVITSSDKRPFTDTKVFDCAYSTQEESYTLSVPLTEADHIRIAERNFENANVERSVQTNGTQVVYTWTLRDRPAVKPEPGMPAAELFAPTLYVAHRDAAAHRTVPALLAQIDALLDGDYPLTEAATEELLAEIDEDNVDACLKAIQTFIARRVPQIGPAWNTLAYGTVTDPDTTLASGYGNRLDRIVLWLAMLRFADIQAEIVFADNESLATAYAFSHQVAAREVPRWTRWTRPYIRLADGRLVGDGAELDEIAVTGISSRALMTARGRELYHVDANLRTRTERNIRMVVSANGDAVIASEVFGYGLEAGATRRAVREFTPETRRRAIAALADSLAVGAVPCSEHVVDTAAYPVRSRLAVTAKNYAIRQGALLTIPLQRFLAPVYSLRGTRRENPIWQNEVAGYAFETDIWLPKGSEIVTRPEPFKVTLPGGGVCELSLKEEQMDYTGLKRLTYTVRMVAAPAVLDNWYFPACVELNRRLAAPEMRTIVVRLPE